MAGFFTGRKQSNDMLPKVKAVREALTSVGIVDGGVILSLEKARDPRRDAADDAAAKAEEEAAAAEKAEKAEKVKFGQEMKSNVRAYIDKASDAAAKAAKSPDQVETFAKEIKTNLDSAAGGIGTLISNAKGPMFSAVKEKLAAMKTAVANAQAKAAELGGSSATPAQPAAAAACWAEHTDGEDTWYESPGKASVWKVPDGENKCGGGSRRRKRGGDKPLGPKPDGGRRKTHRRHPRRFTRRRR